MTPSDLERLIRRDPAGRGLVSSDCAEEFCVGHLAKAAHDLAERGTSVGIVTGFFVPDADPPAAETDGLAGSLLLADVLRSLGISVSLITDDQCSGAVHSAAAAIGSRTDVSVCPIDTTAAGAWRDRFETASVPGMSHLIAIERVAPSYTVETLAARDWGDEETIQRFQSKVPAVARGRCHNMRGCDIEASSADLYQLFEDRQDGLRTIGIGDGGNEIGMGNIPWPQLVDAIGTDHAARIASRTMTDWTILAGVSDWGAFALAAAVCLVRADTSPLAAWTADRIERLLDAAVADGPAIDGITRRPEPTVDGLPFITYIQPWLHIRQQLGLDGVR